MMLATLQDRHGVMPMMNVSSFYVAPEFRRQGYGTELLQQTRHKARKLGMMQLNFYYMTGSAGGEEIENMLLAAGCKGPVTRMVVGKRKGRFEPPWLNMFPFPASCRSFPWRELTPADRQYLVDIQRRERPFPDYLWPFKDNFQETEPINSLGLKKNGRVIGWLLTHRLDAVTIRYSNICLHRDHQGFGLALPLLSESIVRHNLYHRDIPRAIFSIFTPNKIMLKFAKKILMPYMTEMKESRVVYFDHIRHEAG